MTGPAALKAVLSSSILESIAVKLLDGLKKPPGVVAVDTSRGKEAVQQHAEYVSRWASDVSFGDLGKSKRLQDSFVDLDLHLGSAKLRKADRGALRVSNLRDLAGHSVILGDPGAGKTTSLKRLAQVALQDAIVGAQSKMPVLIALRDLGPTGTIADQVLIAFGASIRFASTAKEKERDDVHLQIASQLLATGCSYLLLDGLDEVHPKAREHVVSEVRRLCLQFSTTRVLLTCRSGDYVYHFAQTRVLTIEPLSAKQIEQFATQWLGRDNAKTFVAKVKANPYSGTEVRPLTLAHLCAIYERSGRVPDKPRTVYKKIVRLLLEEWDEERSVRRYSRYAGFDVDRKEDFLEALAYRISRHLQSSTFTDAELRDAYVEIHEDFGLPVREAGKVVRELESHTGLIVQVTHDTYSFTHKSIQEFLAANFILKLPTVPGAELFELPNEAALAVSLSSAPGTYFATLVERLDFDRYLNLVPFTEPFYRRLVVERVDWTVSMVLGDAVLWLISRTYHPDLDDGRVGQTLPRNSAVLQLLAHRAVAQSVGSALRSCSVRPGTEHVLLATHGGKGSPVREYAVPHPVAAKAIKRVPSAAIERLLHRTTTS